MDLCAFPLPLVPARGADAYCRPGLELLLFPFRRFVGGCPNDPHSEIWKPQKYGRKCGAYCPDMLAPRPPDLPPSLAPLTLIEGGKGDKLPAGPAQPGRRRRVGEE